MVVAVTGNHDVFRAPPDQVAVVTWRQNCFASLLAARNRVCRSSRVPERDCVRLTCCDIELGLDRPAWHREQRVRAGRVPVQPDVLRMSKAQLLADQDALAVVSAPEVLERL